jgi:hypothetical protein
MDGSVTDGSIMREVEIGRGKNPLDGCHHNGADRLIAAKHEARDGLLNESRSMSIYDDTTSAVDGRKGRGGLFEM